MRNGEPPSPAAERCREGPTSIFMVPCVAFPAYKSFFRGGLSPFRSVNPASGEFVLGAPQAPGVTLRLPEGRTFRIVAKGLSNENKYVKSISLNGRPLDGFVIRYADMLENAGFGGCVAGWNVIECDGRKMKSSVSWCEDVRPH